METEDASDYIIYGCIRYGNENIEGLLSSALRYLKDFVYLSDELYQSVPLSFLRISFSGCETLKRCETNRL